jgi:hypothetical protein
MVLKRDGRFSRAALPAILGLACLAGRAWSEEIAPPKPEDGPDKVAGAPLRDLDAPGEEYRTPRAGEGFHTTVFGEEVNVPPRDRRSVTAWNLGLSAAIPEVPESTVLPFGSFFLWRRPDEDTFFRAVLVGLYDDVYLSKSAPSLRPFEGILTFKNITVPVDQAEYADGVRLDEEELLWGSLYGGIGFGMSQPLDSPGENDNMAAIGLIYEPGYLFFDDGHDTGPAYVVPQDTFESRFRLRLRWDGLLRNLLELPHSGLAFGGDVYYGLRSNWEDWGPGGSEHAADGRSYVAASAYLLGAGGVPFVESERHRLIGTLHGGTGSKLDRFSSFRIGGGPWDAEFDTIPRPIIPGSVVEEFVTDHYVVATGEYRWEPIFFAYIGARGSVAYLERLRHRNGQDFTSDDVLFSLGVRIATGFLFDTRLLVDFNHNFEVRREDGIGGNEITAYIAGEF